MVCVSVSVLYVYWSGFQYSVLRMLYNYILCWIAYRIYNLLDTLIHTSQFVHCGSSHWRFLGGGTVGWHGEWGAWALNGQSYRARFESHFCTAFRGPQIGLEIRTPHSRVRRPLHCILSAFSSSSRSFYACGFLLCLFVASLFSVASSEMCWRAMPVNYRWATLVKWLQRLTRR